MNYPIRYMEDHGWIKTRKFNRVCVELSRSHIGNSIQNQWEKNL